MIRLLWTALIFLLCCSTLHAQLNPSVDSLLRQANDPKRLPESVILLLADRLPDFDSPVDIAVIKARLSAAYLEAGILDSAAASAWHVITLTPWDKELAAQAYLTLGTVAFRKASLDRALDLFRKSLQLLQENRDRRGILMAQSQMAEIEAQQGKYTEAVYDYQQAIAGSMELGDQNSQTSLTLQLGGVYLKLKRYPEALTFLTQAAESSRLLADSSGMSLAYSQLGALYIDRADYERALDYYSRSLELDRSIGLKFTSYHNLAELYVHKNKLDTAVLYEDSTKTVLGSSTPATEMRDYFQSRYRIAEMMGDTARALNYFKMFALYNDSVRQAEAEIRVRNVHDDLILGANEASIRRSELQLKLEDANTQLDKQWLYIRFMSVGFLVLLVLLSFLWYRARGRMRQAVRDKEVKLDELTALNEKLFTVVGHDLQAPLATFSNLTRSLAERMKTIRPDEVGAYLEHMHTASVDLERSLTHAVEWSLVQSGSMPFHPEQFNCRQMATEVVDKLHMEASQKNHKIEFLIPDAQQAFADRTMVAMVLRNMLSNAIRFTPPGKVITLFSGKKESLITLGIKDQGSGISADKLKGVFEWKDNTQGQPHSGLGIGLPLCKDLVSRNGGKVYAESKPGEGSTFYFSLPEHRPVDQPAE